MAEGADTRERIASLDDFLGEEVSSKVRPSSASTVTSSAGPDFTAEDYETLVEGIRLMLTNRLEEGQAFLEKKSAEAQKRKRSKDERDPRPHFFFITAMAAMSHGMATLQNEQLAMVLTSLQKADELAKLESGPAKVVLKGFTMLLMGVVNVMQGTKAKGVWQILRSWTWLRLLEGQALNVQGEQRKYIRSSALLALGLFNMLVSFLPPNLMRTASWASGVVGDREEALANLQICWEEDGLLAPIAVLVLVGYEVDVRTFLGEPRTEESRTRADTMLTWCEERFPGGVFFTGLRSNFHAVDRDLDKAISLCESSMLPVADQLPALGLFMHFRLAHYAQGNLAWSRAAKAFRDAIEVHRKAERRSLVPAGAGQAALCHELAGETEERDEMINLVLAYQQIPDKKWGFPDKWAFRLAERFKAGTWEPNLEVAAYMVMKQRTAMFMVKSNIDVMVKMVTDVKEGTADPDKKGRCELIRAEILRQQGAFEDALAACSQGIALQPSLSKEGMQSGVIQYMHYIAAHAEYGRGNLTEAKDWLGKLQKLPRKYDLSWNVSFKSTQLSRRLGLNMKDTFIELTVPNRNILKMSTRITPDIDLVEWEWALADFTLSFEAVFQPDSGGPSVSLQKEEKYDATNGPSTGKFEPTESGTLTLNFDNKFSMLRGKSVLCRVLPEFLVLTPDS